MRHATILHASAAFTVLLFTATSASAAKLSPLGVWYDHDGRGAVEIKPCGNRLCGRLVWARSAKDRKRGCGKKIISGLQKTGAKVWDNGKIYSPESNSTYDVEVRPLSANKLRVLGYAGAKIFSKTMYWKRAPASLVRCDRPAPAPAKSNTSIIAGTTPVKPVTPPIPGKNTARAPTQNPAPAAQTKTAAVTPPSAPSSIVAPKPARVQRDPAQPTTINKPGAPSNSTDPSQPATTAQPSGADTPNTRTATANTNNPDRDRDARTSGTNATDTSPNGDNPDNDADRAARANTRQADTTTVDDPPAVDTQPRKKRRTARYKNKKMCSFNAPFVTISFPCKN